MSHYVKNFSLAVYILPRDFKWQPSARVSQTFTVFLPQECDSSYHVTKPKCPPGPRPSGIPGVAWRHPTRNLATDVSQTVTGSATILAPPPLRLQKHPDLRAHDFAHSRCMWHEPSFANCSYVWSRRLCGITRTIASAMTTSWRENKFLLWRNLHSRVMFFAPCIVSVC